jgi:hypothetical protein
MRKAKFIVEIAVGVLTLVVLTLTIIDWLSSV